MIFGYARVSTKDQKLKAQKDLLKKAGCEQIYSDIASGVREDRSGLNEMLKFLRKGDTVITYKNDRMFRSLKNMIQLIDEFNEKEVHFKVLRSLNSILPPQTESSFFRYLLLLRNSKETSFPNEPKWDWQMQEREINYWEGLKELKKIL